MRHNLLRSWSWLTALDCEIPSSPDTLWVLLTGFASMASTALESIVFGRLDLIWFLKSEPNFLEPFGSCTVIDCASTFSHDKCFWLLPLHSDPIQTHIKHKFLNYTELHVHLCGFQITHGTKQCTMCQHIKYHNTTNNSGYLPQLDLVWSCDIHAAN